MTAEIKIPIIMSKNFKDKIDWLSINYENEIGGWITGRIGKNIYLEDLLIPQQEAGGSFVNMSGKQIALLRKEYGDKCKKIIGEWHSHNDMGSFWSFVDEDLIEQVMKPRKIFLFIVSSKGEHKIRIEIRKPFFISVDDLPYLTDQDAKIIEFLKKEIKNKIKEEEFSEPNTRQLRIINDFKEVKTVENYEMKETLKRILKYNSSEKTITLHDLPWFYADGVCQEFQDYNPEMVSMRDGLHYDILFATKNKVDAIKLIKELKDFLKMVLIEEYL